MNESVMVLVIIILAFILMWTSGTLLMGMIYKRTVKDLLVMFRSAKAFSPETAKYLDELGIKRQSLMNFRVVRDYTPQVLQMLITENIVHTTEEGKVYLSEKTLAGHKLGASINNY